MKKKWLWLLLVPVILGLCALGWVYRDTVSLYLAPKAVLGVTINDTVSQMEQRFEDNPVLLVLKHLHPQGKQTATIRAVGTSDLLGQVEYDMVLQTHTAGHEYSARGRIHTADRDLNLEAYFNSSFLAFSSVELVQSRYYGITYDTFREDLEQIPVLSWFLTESMIAKIEAPLVSLRTMAERNYRIPQMPPFTQEDIEMLTIGVLALPSKVDKVQMKADGQLISCHRVRYSAEGEQVREILDSIMDTAGADRGSVQADFYLLEDKSLLMADVYAAAGENRVNFQLTFAGSPLTEPVTFRWTEVISGIQNAYTVRVTTERTPETIRESWSVQAEENGQALTTAFSYQQNVSTGDMTLMLDGGVAVKLNLTQEDGGFRIRSEEFHLLLDALNQEKKASKPFSCDMLVSKGADFATPEYRNLSQWSMDDFLTLLEGIGGLLGISI